MNAMAQQDAAASPTRRIAQWVAALPPERTGAVQAQALAGIQDLVGCMIAGSVEPAARQVARVAAGWGPGKTTIVGMPAMVPATSAAFANGVAAHLLDFDDSFDPLTGHPSAPMVPALLAVAQERGLPGAAVLDAYVVGLDVMAALGRVMNPAHYMAGWHSTSSIGVIGAAAALARLLGLVAEGVTAAISNAVSFSGGSRLQLGYAMKSVHAGMAARDAVVAATLAESGIAGNPEPLLGPRGFLALHGGQDARAEALALPGSGEPLAICRPGITFKPYPTCGSTHRSLDALLTLREQHGLRADQVEDVELTIPALNVRNLVYDRPASGLEAKFSMPYCAAVALMYGEVTLADFTPEAIARPEIGRLMPRVRMLTLAGSEDTDKDYLELPARTVLRLKDGRVLEDVRYHRGGSAQAPLSERVRQAKFLACARAVWGPARGEAALAAALALGTAPHVDALMSTLSAEPDRAPG